MGIGIIFVVVFVYIVAKAILRDNKNKRGTSGRYRNDSADSFFFTGNGADLTPGDSHKHHPGHSHHDGNNSNDSHNNHSHGGSSWGSGHGSWDSGHGSHGWDSGGHSGGHDSGGFGGGDSGGGDGGGGGGGD